jgi:hypothetical protein
MTMITLSIRAADISAFVDMPTRRGFREISSSRSRETATHRVSSTYEWLGSPGMELAISIIRMQRKEVRNHENRNIISGSRAFDRHTGNS